jgi:hypothetical protein
LVDDLEDFLDDVLFNRFKLYEQIGIGSKKLFRFLLEVICRFCFVFHLKDLGVFWNLELSAQILDKTLYQIKRIAIEILNHDSGVANCLLHLAFSLAARAR